MSEEIINRVANSKLITIDLEDYYPEGDRVLLDISHWLYEGIVLREKDFREHINNHNWSSYKDKYVAVSCSTDAIIPAWAYMLISIALQPYSKKAIVGNLEALETAIYQDIITNLDVSDYVDKPIIIKGCSKKPVPTNAYNLITNKLKPVAKSIMFGEACSNVPLFKRK
jgi:S-adenosylmethionine/arginine decarboxylase-like enzyme